MIRTIARYGARHVSGTTRSVLSTVFSQNAIKGPAIAEFEKQFADYHRMCHAISASCGRMAFYYILKAFDFPPESEIILPALTFWVIPEMIRVAGFRPVFVDINPLTYNLDPGQIESAITSRTRAIVPTHLYGQPCEMDRILEIARRHDLKIIEDCAHSIGATYRGQKTGTFGDAAFFSFQMLKGLNTYGGGMSITDDDSIARKIRQLSEEEPYPTAGSVRKKILGGYLQRAFISRYGFTFSMFAAFYIASFFGNHDLTRYIWEKIRPLSPLPDSYRKRYSNTQAEIGLQMLKAIDAFNAKARAHADRLSEGLKDVHSILPPATIPEADPVYYQYCIRASDPEALSHEAIRKGIDMEIMHVDICNQLPLFADFVANCPNAESTKHTLQLPVYESLNDKDIDRIIRVVRKASADLPSLESESHPTLVISSEKQDGSIRPSV